MKFDILELLNDEYPQHLSVDEEFFHYECQSKWQNSVIQLFNFLYV